MITLLKVNKMGVLNRMVLCFIAMTGLLIGVYCGYNIENYRCLIAWDKVRLKRVKMFVEWYAKICEKGGDGVGSKKSSQAPVNTGQE